ncbi:DUF2381 family protein [Melittangium boletus]|uniref:DUF2381 family protein n=1 Tax=Melittangium boletus DSM 14713 TaxID=1294270 RepID=A0A250IAB3_9BACT|nr:DUF2381 family protein [Melittangium boletus]ATB28092.1 hypothetical protein MEBOL_001537 [Melittangium boletus DSM 14713]
MSAPVTVLALLFLASAPKPLPPRTGSDQLSGAPRLTVTADTQHQPQEVRISPGRGLMMTFDTPVQREGLVLEAKESFRQVILSDDGLLLTLMPSSNLPLGKRMKLAIRFADGAEPISMDFSLLVSPQAESQWEVYRQPRPAVAYQREAEEARARLQRCQVELNQERTARDKPPGLMGLLAAKQLTRKGVFGKLITFDVVTRQGDAFLVQQATSYRAPNGNSRNPRMRLAVDLKLKNEGTETWAPSNARLVTPNGEWTAEVWPPEPIPPGGLGRILVEVELPGSVPPGPCMLKLWDKAETQVTTLSGIIFP